MSSRSSRNHARKSAPIDRNESNEPRQPQAQHRPPPLVAFTPPTQLPTPLPEEYIPIVQHSTGSSPGLGLLDFADAADSARDSNANLSRLIDFDTPTPPPALLSFAHHDHSQTQAAEMESSLLTDDDGPGSSTVYRSPPYREARLPAESPPPLPILPRYPQQHHVLNDSEDSQGGFAGHTRAPTFAGSSISAASPLPAVVSPSPTHSRYQSSSTSSTFDSLTRTIRGYAAPSAPRVSRPISYASFSPPAPQVASPKTHARAQSHGYAGRVIQQEFERDYEREQPEEGAYYGYGYPSSPPPPHPSAHLHSPSWEHGHYAETQPGHRRSPPPSLPQHRQPRHQAPVPVPPQPQSSRFMGSGLAQAIRRGAAAGVGVVSGRGMLVSGSGAAQASRGGVAGVVGKREGEQSVVWAHWDVLQGRRVLLLAYPAGLQMWDCADLNALREVFNLDLGAQEWALMVGGSEGAPGRQRVRVVHASVLPDPVGGKEKDTMVESRPLLGMLLESADDDEREHEAQSVFVVYSLRTHQVVKMRPMPGLSSTFSANQNFVVIATTLPPTLHILSSTSFHTLHIITAAHLEPFATPALSRTTSTSAISITNAISNTAQSTSVSLGLSIDTGRTNPGNNASGNDSSGKATPDGPPEPPHPVFALHHRLLAYASPSPASSPSLLPISSSSKASHRLSSSSAGSVPSNAASSLSSSPFGLGKIASMTQADVGHAALKVGESVFSGMKFIGGMALEAAKNRVVGPEGRVGAFGSGSGRTGIPVAGGQRGTSTSPGSGGKFVSRSAPDNDGGAAEDVVRERRYSNTSNLSGWDQRERNSASGGGSTPNSPNPHLTTVAPSTRPVAESGHYVTVVDLAPLLSGLPGAVPAKINEFNVSRSKPVVDLSFAQDGTSVAAVLRDGHTVRVFKVQPTPRVLLRARAAAVEAAAAGLDEIEMKSEMGRRAAHVYDLYRGRTSAVVEGLEWAKDGRWLAVGTRNRTIHVFGVNPYGGKSDVKSHMEGRVRNVDVIESRLTTLHPLVRLRGPKTSAEQATAPLAFTFTSPCDVASSTTLMFPFEHPPISNSPTFSPPKLKRAKNYQDLLVFDPVDGVLSLRRLAVNKQPVKEQGIGGGVAASVQALGVTSISLPGMGGAGRLSSSPSNRGGGITLSSGRSVSSTKVEEPQMELVVKESVEATWDLKRGRDWVEIKTPVLSNAGKVDSVKRGVNAPGRDWLAAGEISTCSNSTRILPRSLYLSHQFSFHTLGEDYHALIRRYQFDISGGKIDVRKAVEISAYASGGGESAFVEGFSSPLDIRRPSSSFDEPIASAISGSFDNSNLPTVLPMYPNGVPGSKPKSFRNSIPIRTMTGIGDGVSEGIGRIRREMNKTRSPQLVARPDILSEPVPLEFDEEDEDFIGRDTLKVPSDRGNSSISRDTSREGASAESASSLATPANMSTHHLMDADVVGTMEEDLWDGWDPQDKLAVEEAEQFHDITAVGYVEEEQPHIAVVSDQTPVVAKRKGRAKRRG